MAFGGQFRGHSVGQMVGQLVGQLSGHLAGGSIDKLLVAAKKWALLPRHTGRLPIEVRAGADGWMVCESGSTLPLRVFDLKKEAVRVAERIARQHKTKVIVFKKDGNIQSNRVFH